MTFRHLKSALAKFRNDTGGAMTVELVITLPLLFWMIATCFELYEVHRHKAVRIKATYAVADMLSREMELVGDSYIAAAKNVFDSMAQDNAATQMRMSVVKYDSEAAKYEVRWSKIRGEGPMSELTEDAANANDQLPNLQPGEDLVIVESTSIYIPLFGYPGLGKEYDVNTRIFTGARFDQQICWDDDTPCS